ncbi:hypothetical protein N7931_18390 [Catenovulum sp. 2E275]|uniref:WD40 repeat domain-containing protein n=1 Tax=Catenovulum sp. 2E275 TaxID=2980497 RepID=UPI0021CE6A51|nr:hypothetical protein [Catenovulum sp. 2E275]MCU4677591.1 hypothetical protein [Catenovulum sp. 2E275]
MANFSNFNFSAVTRLSASYCLSFLLLACNDQPVNEVLYQTHTDNGAYAADLSVYGQFAAVSSNQGVRFWDIKTGLPKYLWQHEPNQTNQVGIVKISFDNQLVLTADKQSFALWNINTGANKGYYKIDDANIVTAAVSKQGHFVALGLLNGKILHIDMQTGRRIEYLSHQDRISALEMSANGRYILSGDYAGKAILWDTQTAQSRFEFNHNGRISQLSLDNQARFAFTANSTNESWIWDLTTGKRYSQLNYIARQQIFTAVKFSNNGKLLATGAPNQKIKIWSVESGELIAEWPFDADHFAATVLDFAFSENDKLLSAETSFGALQTWELSF